MPGMPEPTAVARTACRIYLDVIAHPKFRELAAAALQHCRDWPSLSGELLVAQWRPRSEPAPLLEEAVRAVTLSAAAYERARGEDGVEGTGITIPAPVAAMMHAVAAQTHLFQEIVTSLGLTVVYRADQEHAYTATSYTAACYRAAWGEPPARYWLDHQEAERRRAVLGELYARVGIGRSGQHDIAFEAAPVGGGAA